MADLFWADETEARARRRVSQALWEIRAILRQIDSAHTYLLADKGALQFNSQVPYWLDVKAFRRKLQQGDARPQAPSLSMLEEALNLCGLFIDPAQKPTLALRIERIWAT